MLIVLAGETSRIGENTTVSGEEAAEPVLSIDDVAMTGGDWGRGATCMMHLTTGVLMVRAKADPRFFVGAVGIGV